MCTANPPPARRKRWTGGAEEFSGMELDSRKDLEWWDVRIITLLVIYFLLPFPGLALASLPLALGALGGERVVQLQKEEEGGGKHMWPNSNSTAGWDAKGGEGKRREALMELFFSEEIPCKGHSSVVLGLREYDALRCNHKKKVYMEFTMAAPMAKAREVMATWRP
ncbi:hypothetical protein MUK42_05663 [Musa troglodytarum]|uniref:Uncharacterized protein n=1 Tax=Musa troglodytarum TaxID=320322 RepID=A0A9E7KAD7_9LILI|nr:hypothetical protein MUK42_05663 [Musa troglodytarum]